MTGTRGTMERVNGNEHGGDAGDGEHADNLAAMFGDEIEVDDRIAAQPRAGEAADARSKRGPGGQPAWRWVAMRGLF